MKENKNYTYSKVEEFAEKNDFDLEELGNNQVGENFLILKSNSKDISISFVLTGSSNKDFIYKCIYSDLT
jgi:hypothetical protein